MNYDCSITNRKGCNYCLREKDITNSREFDANIYDGDKELYIENDESRQKLILKINYCPICGRKL